MAETKAYVRIASQKSIRVTCGLQNKDVTNPDAHVADRLKISPQWPTCTVLIKRGSHLYPSEIASWNTVKALARDKTITIGEFTDTPEEDVANVSNALRMNLKQQGLEKKSTTKKTSLADIAGE